MKVVCLLGLVAFATLANSAPAPKAAHEEYISIIDFVDAANLIKQIFEEMNAEIEAGVVGYPDILKHVMSVVEAKIQEVSPVVAEILVEMKAAIQDVIDLAEAGIDAPMDTLLHELFEGIMAKFEDLKNKIIGEYNIFGDLGNIIGDIIGPIIDPIIDPIGSIIKVTEGLKTVIETIDVSINGNLNPKPIGWPPGLLPGY